MLLNYRGLTSHHVPAEAQDLIAHTVLACGKYEVIQLTFLRVNLSYPSFSKFPTFLHCFFYFSGKIELKSWFIFLSCKRHRHKKSSLLHWRLWKPSSLCCGNARDISLSQMLGKGWSQRVSVLLSLRSAWRHCTPPKKELGRWCLTCILLYCQPNHNAAFRSEQALGKSKNNSVTGPEQNYVVFDLSDVSL